MTSGVVHGGVLKEIDVQTVVTERVFRQQLGSFATYFAFGTETDGPAYLSMEVLLLRFWQIILGCLLFIMLRIPWFTCKYGKIFSYSKASHQCYKWRQLKSFHNFSTSPVTRKKFEATGFVHAKQLQKVSAQWESMMTILLILQKISIISFEILSGKFLIISSRTLKQAS